MSIRGNRYNDPALGQAFNNIASIFAPPSAQDMAGYATASAKKEEAERLAWLFENADDPLADRKATMAGVYNPTQSYYAQNQNNATAVRGQDVAASTSITNNRADNERAVATNLTDNRFGLAEQFMTPLNPGQLQPGLPDSIAGAFGVPEMPRTEGLPKPMSETEAKGQAFNDLRGNGTLDEDLLLEQILGAQAPVKVEGANGPVFSTPGAAARTGAPAFIDAGSQPTPDVQNYRTPDGASGTAVYRDGQGWVDTQTNQPLPAGSQTIKATATGSADDALGPRAPNITRARQLRADITSMNGLVGELETTIKSAAGTAGLAASVQSFFQDSRQVVKELAAATGADPNAPITPETLKSLSDSVLGADQKYNPTFRRVHAMLLDLAYMNARLNNPSGEVSRFALERELEALGQGLTGNDQSVLASVDVARQRMARGLDQAEVLEGRSDGSTRDDVLRPTGGTAPPPPGTSDVGLPVFATPEEAAAHPPGTRFKTPDGRVKVVPMPQVEIQ